MNTNKTKSKLEAGEVVSAIDRGGRTQARFRPVSARSRAFRRSACGTI